MDLHAHLTHEHALGMELVHTEGTYYTTKRLRWDFPDGAVNKNPPTQMKLSHYLLIGLTPIQNKKF